VVQSTILKNSAKTDNKKDSKLNKLVRKYCLKNEVDYINLNAFLSRDVELIKKRTTNGWYLQQQAFQPWCEAIKSLVEIRNIMLKFDR